MPKIVFIQPIKPKKRWNIPNNPNEIAIAQIQSALRQLAEINQELDSNHQISPKMWFELVQRRNYIISKLELP